MGLCLCYARRTQEILRFKFKNNFAGGIFLCF